MLIHAGKSGGGALFLLALVAMLPLAGCGKSTAPLGDPEQEQELAEREREPDGVLENQDNQELVDDSDKAPDDLVDDAEDQDDAEEADPDVPADEDVIPEDEQELVVDEPAEEEEVALPDDDPDVDVTEPEPEAEPEQVERPWAPIDELDDLKLYINLGDSLSAGYNAVGRNGVGGQGYSRLLLDNHSLYPEYNGHALVARFPAMRYADLGESGAKSWDALENLQNALTWQPWVLPWSVDGDVLVTLTCGGNNFNDDINVMANRLETIKAADRLDEDYQEIVRLIRERYENPARGYRVVFLITNVHDPTDGRGTVPAEFSEGFCEQIRQYALLGWLAIGNLEYFNGRMADTARSLGGYLVDNHEVFSGHGMNSGVERWIDDDCVHPLSYGHHQLRRAEWRVLTGESY